MCYVNKVMTTKNIIMLCLLSKEIFSFCFYLYIFIYIFIVIVLNLHITKQTQDTVSKLQTENQKLLYQVHMEYKNTHEYKAVK